MSIATEITRLQNAKAVLKESIKAKGVTVEDNAKLDEYPALVDSIPQGSGGVEEKDINFYDYDGTCLYSYTKDEFLALSEMPANPDHTDEGLISDGWGWTLEDAKTYVNKYGKNNIGQAYSTSDNKTKIVINIPRNNITFTLSFGSSDNTTFDWGDGTINTQPQDNASHLYLKKGIYTILVGTGNDIINISTSSITSLYLRYLITKIFFGKTYYYVKGFGNLNNLKIVTFSNFITSIDSYAFRDCKSLNFINLNNITTLAEGGFYHTNLKAICFKSQGISTIPQAFFSDNNFKNISLPNSITNIGVSSFGFIYTIDIPENVIKIERMAFYSGIFTAYLFPVNPPTIESNTFTTHDNLKIYVPAESVEAYKTATNWSALADKIFPIPTE